MSTHDPFPFDFEGDQEFSSRRKLSPAQDQASQIVSLRDQVVELRRELAFANRALDEATKSISISRQLTTASLVETRDLCMPHVTKSLLYATVEMLDEIKREEGGLPDEYIKVRRRTIDQLEKFETKGVYTTQEESERVDAIKRDKVLIRFEDIMRPRELMDPEDAVELLSSADPSRPRIVIDGTLPQPAQRESNP